jgi:hypothetical protein
LLGRGFMGRCSFCMNLALPLASHWPCLLSGVRWAIVPIYLSHSLIHYFLLVNPIMFHLCLSKFLFIYACRLFDENMSVLWW